MLDKNKLKKEWGILKGILIISTRPEISNISTKAATAKVEFLAH